MFSEKDPSLTTLSNSSPPSALNGDGQNRVKGRSGGFKVHSQLQHYVQGIWGIKDILNSDDAWLQRGREVREREIVKSKAYMLDALQDFSLFYCCSAKHGLGGNERQGSRCTQTDEGSAWRG